MTNPIYTDPMVAAQRRLIAASFEVGQAQAALDDAFERFKDAQNAVEFLENRSIENKD